jgi:AcrR family transcriptional regulator
MARTIAKDHNDKAHRIRKIAAEVFAREGIARASMNEVASACGVSKANIYHYYPSKDDIVFDILDCYLSDLVNWIDSLDIANVPPPEQLRITLREFLLAYEGMDHEHKIQSEGLPLLPAEQQAVLKRHQRRLVTVVSDILAACAPETLGQDRGKRRDTTMAVFGMLNWFYMWHPQAEKSARLSYAASIADLTLHGILRPQSATSPSGGRPTVGVE